MRCHLILVRIAVMEEMNNDKAGEETENREH
jgi:hypothetical protein